MSEIALSVAFVGVILLIGVFLKLLSEKKGYPLTLFLLLLGIIVGHVFKFNPEDSLTSVGSFVTLALVIVLFDAGMTINVRRLYKNIAAPFTFGMIAVGLTIASVAVFAKMILGLDYIFGLILGSILASTDLTIIAPIFNSMKVKPQVKEFIEIESSINSIFAAVFVVVLINLYETGAKLAFSADILSTGLQTLLYNIFVGAGLGLVIGYLILRFITKLSAGQMPHLVMFGSLFFTYAISELLGASGIATALAIGIVFGNSKTTVPSIIKSFGGEMELILVTFVYFLLGAIIDFNIIYNSLIPALILVSLVYLSRYISVKYFTKGMEKLRKFTLLSSPRGITCAVLTLSYSSIFPNPALIIGLVFSVILISSLSMFLIPKSLPKRY